MVAAVAARLQQWEERLLIVVVRHSYGLSEEKVKMGRVEYSRDTAALSATRCDVLQLWRFCVSRGWDTQ